MRAIVALSDAGRTRVDEVARAWDLLLVDGVATLGLPELSGPELF